MRHVWRVVRRGGQIVADGYQEYLQSRQWQAKRDAVMRRAHDRCEFMTTTDGFERRRCCERAVDVHHLTYMRLFDEKLTDLLAVCRYHHRLAHDRVGDAERRQMENLQFRKIYGP